MKRTKAAAALLISIAFFAAVSILVINSVLDHQENAALIAQNHELITEGKVKDARATARDTALLDEVHVLLARQGRQARRTVAVNNRLASVLSYLHRVGVTLPARITGAGAASSARVVTVTPRTHGKRHGKKK